MKVVDDTTFKQKLFILKQNHNRTSVDSLYKGGSLNSAIHILNLMPKKQSTKDAKRIPTVFVNHPIEQRILMLRGQKFVVDSDLAQLYGVETRVLNQAVKRNLDRFPEDFMFQLTKEELVELNRSQIVIGSQKHRDPRYLPYAFTEHGAVMLVSVLNSPVAIDASIQVVRAFVKLRSILAAHKELAKKLEELEKKTDTKFKVVFDLIGKYLKPKPEQESKRIGFATDEAK